MSTVVPPPLPVLYPFAFTQLLHSNWIPLADRGTLELSWKTWLHLSGRLCNVKRKNEVALKVPTPPTLVYCAHARPLTDQSQNLTDQNQALMDQNQALTDQNQTSTDQNYM